MPSPVLHRLDAPGTPSGVVLMLHGGRASGRSPVGRRSASWWRARLMQHQIAPRAHEHGVSVWLLRYRLQGWNAGSGELPSPVPDARWALAEARRELGAVPVVLLGHSMGARTAVAVADAPSVVGVVGLAAWLPEGEPVHRLEGRRLAVAHGRADRITSFRATEAFVHRAAAVASTIEVVDLDGAGHYMLRGLRRWNQFAVSRSVTFVREHSPR